MSILSIVIYVSQAGELMAIRTLSSPQKRFARISRMVSLFENDSVGDFKRRMRGAMNTGDSKHIANSRRKRLFDKKLRLGRSIAKFIYF